MDGAPGSLAGARVAIIGRLARATPARIDRALARHGARLATGLRDCTLAAVGHGAAAFIRSGRLASALERLRAAGAVCLSERGLMRRLGLMAPPDAAPREIDAVTFATLARLSPSDLGLLTLFDLFDPVEGRYQFRELALARRCGILLERGVAIEALAAIAGAMDLRPGQDSIDLDALGALVVRTGHLELDRGGQLRLPLNARNLTLDELRAEAWDAEDQGDLALAERLYATVLLARPWDAVSRFNLANVLVALGRPRDAVIELRLALHHDAGLIDGWYNLGIQLEALGDRAGAVSALREAVALDPTYAAAIYMLALLLFRDGDFAAAAPLWERLLSLQPDSADARTAARALAVCRMADGEG